LSHLLVWLPIARADPVSFSAAFLGQANAAYAEWILQPKTWGGAIELSILSDYYSTEICAFDVATTRMDCYGAHPTFLHHIPRIF
jgi:ubiquitin thioesterase OTU1